MSNISSTKNNLILGQAFNFTEKLHLFIFIGNLVVKEYGNTILILS